MLNYYSTVDNQVLTFSNIITDNNGFEKIKARFERANDKGFDYSEWILPGLSNTKAYGFSEDEIMTQERYLLNNLLLIWEIAREKELIQSA